MPPKIPVSEPPRIPVQTKPRPPVLATPRSLNDLSGVPGLRELPGLPLEQASKLRPSPRPMATRPPSSASPIITLVTLGESDRPTEATGEIDTRAGKSERRLARAIAMVPLAAATAMMAMVGIHAAFNATSPEYVGGEWAQAGLVMATTLAALLAATACRLILGRRTSVVVGAAVIGLAIGWAARMALGGGVADVALAELTPMVLLETLTRGLEQAANLQDVQLLLTWGCEATLLLWFAASLGSRKVATR